ncbi:MAG: hypothetical protein QM770_16245 [Tepidisphaeraceae bacterium]
MQLTPDQERSIREAIAADRLIEAIKLYREATNVGLAEAKAAVEAMRDGVPLASTQPLSRVPGLTEAQQNEIRDKILAGQKIEAIRLHRAATGMDLFNAKQAVEALEVQLRASGQHPAIPQRGGCLGLVLLPLAVPIVVLRWLV